jgi:hypothetical protein
MKFRPVLPSGGQVEAKENIIDASERTVKERKDGTEVAS